MLKQQIKKSSPPKTNHTCINDFICVFGSTKPALISSNEYSISSGMSSTTLVPKETGGGGAGVIAVCIGTDTVEGVEGTGRMARPWGVLFSSFATEIVLEGVVNCKLLVACVFCNVSLCVMFRSSDKFVMLFFDDAVEEMGENGTRIMGESTSRTVALPNECFLTGRPAISKPLRPTYISDEIKK